MSEPFRVVVCTSRTHGAVIRVVRAIHEAESQGRIKLVGIVFDMGRLRPNKLKKVARWYRRGGIRYVVHRIVSRASARSIGKQRAVLFDLAGELKLPVEKVPSINSGEARNVLRSWKADIGVSSGNRLINESVFTIPSHGMINLHHGMMPDYRGGPPGFWELYNGEETMGITVHVMNRKLDSGKILGQRSFAIEYERDDPESLYRKAGQVDGPLVVEVLEALARGQDEGQPLPHGKGKVYTLPTRRECKALEKRLGRPVEPLGYRNV